MTGPLAAKIATQQLTVGWPAYWKKLLGERSITLVNGSTHRKLRSCVGYSLSNNAMTSFSFFDSRTFAWL